MLHVTHKCLIIFCILCKKIVLDNLVKYFFSKMFCVLFFNIYDFLSGIQYDKYLEKIVFTCPVNEASVLQCVFIGENLFRCLLGTCVHVTWLEECKAFFHICDKGQMFFSHSISHSNSPTSYLASLLSLPSYLLSFLPSFPLFLSFFLPSTPGLEIKSKGFLHVR